MPLSARVLDATPSRILAGDDHGSLTLLSADLTVLAASSACHQHVTAVHLLPRTELLTFACREGAAGIARYDASTRSITVIDRFATLGSADDAIPDEAHQYVTVYSNSNRVYIYSIPSRLVTEYQGRSAQISSVASPTPDFPYFLVGDVNGAVRVWTPPSGDARAVLRAPTAVFTTAFSPDGRSLVTDGADGIARNVRLADGAITELRGHRRAIYGVQYSPDGKFILTAGLDGALRTWRASDGAAARIFTGHSSAVNDAAYLTPDGRIGSVSDDGQLLLWSPDGLDVFRAFSSPKRLTGLELLTTNHHAVVQDAEGSIWDIAFAPTAGPRQVHRGDGAAISVLRASPDGRFVATGSSTGDVVVYDTTTWTPVATSKAAGAIRQLAFDPLDRDLAIASEDGRVHLVPLPLGLARILPWHDLAIPARDVTYAPDGETMAFVCADGATWFYDARSDTWAYTRDHDSDTLSGQFSPDGSYFASPDVNGIVTLRNVTTTFTAIRRDRTPPRTLTP